MAFGNRSRSFLPNTCSRVTRKTFSNWPTFPQLYIKGELVGGCDIALEMAASGELKKLVDETNAR